MNLSEQMVKYNLYDRKTLNASDVHDLANKGIPIGYGQWGDSRHMGKSKRFDGMQQNA